MADDGSSDLLVQLEEAVPEGWRRRFARIGMRLLLGSNKVAEIYANGREAIDVANGRSIVTNAVAQAVAAEAIQDQAVMAKARARFLHKVLTEQENVEQVVIGSQKYLSALPPPAQNDSPQNEDKESVDLDEDWVASFTKEAEKATSDSLRDRLSRVLAGEISDPGTYPRAIFRAIVELEKKDIQAIEYLSNSWDRNMIFSTNNDPRFSSSYNTLVEAGLVNTNVMSHPAIVFTDDGKGTFTKVFVKGSHAIILTQHTPTLKVTDVFYLNNAGAAAFSLFNDVSDVDQLRRLAANFNQADLSILLCKVLSQNDDRITYKPLEKIK